MSTLNYPDSQDLERPPKLCLLFPGQGPHNGDLIENLPKASFLSARWEFICQLLKHDPRKLQKDSDVMKNEIASLLTVFASMVQLDEHPEEWEEAQAFAGYSVGQFTALYAAGRLSDLDAIKLVHQRALAMNQCLENSEPSGMIACIGIMETELTKILLDSQLPSLNISNYNSPGQYTISGKKNELEQLLPMLSKARKVLTIPTDGAWHSTYMNGAKESISEFTAQILKFNISHPLPVICNVTGDYLPFDSPENCIDRIGKQVSEPVQWEKGIRHLIKEGFTDFLEMGHGNSLTKFGFFIDRSLSHRVIHSR